jgi:hypothetical protein
MLAQRRYSFRRLGCGACGCLAVLLALIALACVGLFALVRSVQAATPRHVVLLIDQSASVLNQVATRSLVRETALATLKRQHTLDRSSRAVEVRFFGTQATTIISAEVAATATLLDAAFEQSTSLGGTAFLTVLTDLLDDPSSNADVILITDGIPDPVEEVIAYRAQMRALAQQFAQRHIVVSALLIGSAPRGEWLAMWQDFTAITGGLAREIRSADEVASAVQALPFTAPTPTPRPTATRRPTPVPSPTTWPTPTATATLLPIIKPTIATAPAASVSPWPWVLVVIGGLGVVGGIGVLIAMTRQPAPPALPPLHDEGTLEIFDPDRETSQRADLHTMALGEVWGIGGDVQCRLHVEGAGPIEQAALIMTPDGPLLEARGTPLTWEGRVIQSHLLFDGDELYLGQLILVYQNFFRQRPSSEAEDDETAG